MPGLPRSKEADDTAISQLSKEIFEICVLSALGSL